MVRLLCLGCAEVRAVTPTWKDDDPPVRDATGIEGGTSYCDVHQPAGSAPLPAAQECTVCRAAQNPHHAWFGLVGEPLCVRHAAEALFPDDDMGAHFLAHGVYTALRADAAELY